MGGHSVLVFCPTKNWCETLADTVAKAFFQLGRPNPSDMNLDTQEIRAKIQSEIKGKELQEVMEQLKRSPAGLDPVLAKAISFGVAYHHAGTYVLEHFVQILCRDMVNLQYLRKFGFLFILCYLLIYDVPFCFSSEHKFFLKR